MKIVRVAVTAGYASIETEDGSHVFVGPHHEKAAVSITVAIGGDTVQAFAKGGFGRRTERSLNRIRPGAPAERVTDV